MKPIHAAIKATQGHDQSDEYWTIHIPGSQEPRAAGRTLASDLADFMTIQRRLGHCVQWMTAPRHVVEYLAPIDITAHNELIERRELEVFA